MYTPGGIERGTRGFVAGPIPKVTEALIQRWIQNGRGQGEGGLYFPWYTIFDVRGPSLRTRIWGTKVHRIHHLLSLLELILFYHHEFRPSVLDIREQFPLFPREECFDIADQLGVKHPTAPITDCRTVVTTDQFVTIEKGMGRHWEAWSVKYVSDLQGRSLDKLEIERRYWRRRGIPWRLFTDRDLTPAMLHNYRFLHPYRERSALQHLPDDFIAYVSQQLRDEVAHHTILSKLCTPCDHIGSQKPGSAMQVARHLLANATWPLDMHQPLGPRAPLAFRMA